MVIGGQKSSSVMRKNISYSLAFFFFFVLVGSLFTREISVLALTSLWVFPLGVASSFKEKRPILYNILMGVGLVWLVVLVGSLFTREISVLVTTSFWIFPLGIASGFREKHPNLYNVLMAVGVAWLLFVFLYLIRNLFLFFPSLLMSVAFNLIAVLPAYRILGSVKSEKEDKGDKSFVERTISRLYSRARARASGSFWVSILFPFLIYFGSTNLGLVIQADALYAFYSASCQILATLLGISVTLATFLPVPRDEFVRLGDFLNRCVKSLYWLYGVGIVVSLAGLVLVPEKGLIWRGQSTQTQSIISLAAFSSTMALNITCIVFLAIVFFEILEIRSKQQDVDTER